MKIGELLPVLIALVSLAGALYDCIASIKVIGK